MNQILLEVTPSRKITDEFLSKTDVLKDRGSRYAYAIAHAQSKNDIKKFLKRVQETRPFDSADHNSYAFRMLSPEGVLFEGKGDDGEAGAGLCILRELRRENVTNCCLVVARHFGGIKLQNDRFKHVVTVSKIAIDETTH